MAVYVGSDGETYTPGEVVDRLDDGPWRLCASDLTDGRELVETGTGELLLLVPYRAVDDKDGLRERIDAV